MLKYGRPSTLADFVDRHDAGMIELRGGLGFGFEAIAVGLGRELAAQNHLHRDFAAQTRLHRAIDDAHAAAAELLEQFVIAKAGGQLQKIAGEVGRRWTWWRGGFAAARGPGHGDDAPKFAQFCRKFRMAEAFGFEIDGFSPLRDPRGWKCRVRVVLRRWRSRFPNVSYSRVYSTCSTGY